MQKLPIEYHLEVYENSFVNDPSYTLESSSPFPGLNVGDYFNHRMWDGWYNRPNTENQAFRIKEIEHIFWEIEKSHIGHKLMVCLEIAPKEW